MANTLVFAGQTISDDHIFGGVSYLADLNTGEEFSIGNTASASVSFVTDIRLPIYTKDPENGTSTWTQGTDELADNNNDLLVDENNNSFVIETPRGRFYITEVTKSEGFYTVTAYDAMILLETNISALSLTFPLTVSAAASAIAAYIGCTVSGTVNNGTLSVSELNEDMTIRELLGYVAEASGCSVKIDGSDHLCFMYYGDSGITLTASEYKKLEVADYVCAAIDNVTILNSVGAAIATAGSGTNTLYIEANPFLEEATNTEAALILSLVEDFEYAPLTCDLFDADDLEIGTIVTFGETPTLVMHLESAEDGATVSSVGSDSRAEFNKSIETMLAAVSKEALEAADEAATKATKYITKIDNAGIKVHAYDDSTDTPDAANYAKVDGDGLEVYKGGDSVAKYGDEARVGKESTRHIEIKDGGLQVYQDDSTVMANIGYGSGNKQSSGQESRPYYSLGKRRGSSASDIGNWSMSEGYDNKASGYSSHAEGASNDATGIASHAEGNGCTASGEKSHAEGNNTEASGLYSHAEGSHTYATGRASHAEGEEAAANGARSHAGGYFTIANGDNQTVIGKFNAPDTTSLFIVGNGTGSSAKSNAFRVDGNGDVRAKGSVYAGCNADSTGGTKVITEISRSSTTAEITAPANGSVGYTFDVANLVSGYTGWVICYCNTQSSNVLASNYWHASATTVTAYFRNLTASAVTTTAQLTILRWK